LTGANYNYTHIFTNARTLSLSLSLCVVQVGRMKSEVSTDLSKIGVPVREDFEKFAKDTGRKLHLEIEPGTFLVANVGSLVSTVQDIVSTGSDGHTFIKVCMHMCMH
jgi:diaminopimelate decarboxylase